MSQAKPGLLMYAQLHSTDVSLDMSIAESITPKFMRTETSSTPVTTANA